MAVDGPPLAVAGSLATAATPAPAQPQVLSERRMSHRTGIPASRPLPAPFAAVLLASVFVGGLIGAVTAGRFEVRMDMGEGFSRLVTDDPLGDDRCCSSSAA